MGIALTLQQYLSDQSIDYEVMTHELTHSSSRTAHASHVPADRLAKGVGLVDGGSPGRDDTVLGGEDKGARRIPHSEVIWKGVEHNAGRTARSLIVSAGDRHDERLWITESVVERGNAGLVVRYPDEGRRVESDAPRVDEVSIRVVGWNSSIRHEVMLLIAVAGGLGDGDCRSCKKGERDAAQRCTKRVHLCPPAKVS